MTDLSSGVLLVTRNFPPLLGGMERLNQKMLDGLASVTRVYLVGPNGCTQFAPPDTRVSEAPAAPLWRFLPAAAVSALRMQARYRPGTIIAGSGLTAPLAWLAARLFGARCHVYLHGLDLIVPNAIYRMFWLPFIRRCDGAIANSRNTRALAIDRGVPADRIHVINPGTDFRVVDGKAAERFRDVHGLGRRPMLLSVGRLTPRKGLVKFVEEALPAILVQAPDTVFVIIGADAAEALNNKGAQSEQALIVEAARRHGVEHALLLIPPCSDAVLSQAYAAADLHVFPVRNIEGDVEGFGMVAIEAAAHGLLTVAFDSGGVADAVVEGATGSLVRSGDYVEFARQVNRLLGMGADCLQRRERCRAAAQQFGWDIFNARMQQFLQSS